MRILNLKLNNFRNINKLDISFSPNINIIYGDNAQGKTNFLESLWICTGSKSFRNATISQLINFDSKFCNVNMNFESYKRNHEISINLFRGEQKQSFKKNGIKLKSFGSLSGSFCGIVFSPNHLDLVVGSPETRRNFLDYAIAQIKPHYSDLISKYNKSLAQRNKLLNRLTGLKYDKSNLNQLEVWNESLIGFGSSITNYRKQYLNLLYPNIKKYYFEISSSSNINNLEEFSMSYNSVIKNIKLDENIILKDISEIYRKSLTDNIHEDIRMGYTTVGVHRDDLIFKLNNHSAKLYSSQGQKRSIVLALKLAESEVLKQVIKEEPVIFLDDVLSELDLKRQNYILNYIKNKQVFITCCDKSYFQNLQKEKVFYMKNGEVKIEL